MQHLNWALTPPMGWNSWDCFGTAVTEEQTLDNARYMAEHLKAHGWQYIVVDIQWYEPHAAAHLYKEGAELEMDAWGRLLPAVSRFPSARGGAGFKPLADMIHGMGLKFGLHLMRGIPRQAVAKNTPILGTKFHARDIANIQSTCTWNPDMYGLDMSKPGAQEYYDSVFQLFAQWDLDFVKIDDLSRPYGNNVPEIEGYRKAIDRSGRPMVLSTSPGETALEFGEHVSQNANMWRISDDFWDNWEALKQQFERCRKWVPFTGPGYWPDADMLPLGAVRAYQNGWTKFTRDEQYTMMNLWAIARSPLMMGGHMPRNDAFTLSLLTNDAVLAVNQHSSGGRQLFRQDDLVAWVADVPGSSDKYLALFNLNDDRVLNMDLAAYRSDLITRETPKRLVEIELDITGKKKLCLLVDDGGDGNAWDHGDWLNPTLTGLAGTLKLTSLKWTSATTGWGDAHIGRASSGGPLSIEGKVYADGIGTHATSLIEYDLPEGYTRFTTLAGLDDGCKHEGPGSTLRFIVFAGDPFRQIGSKQVAVRLADLGLTGQCEIQELWTGQSLGRFAGTFEQTLRPHASGLFRIHPY